MRIAQIAPLAEAVPPKLYGGTERVIWWLTEALVELGHDVTLYASGDSETSARLVPCARDRACASPGSTTIPPACSPCSIGCCSDADALRHPPFPHRLPALPDLPAPRRQVPDDAARAAGPARLLAGLPRLSARCSWSRSPTTSAGRCRRATSLGTVHHGLPRDLIPFGRGGGDYLAFIGRISPEKRPDRAIEIARRAGMKLKIAAKVDHADRAYFEDEIEPLLDDPLIEFIGEIGDADKPRLPRRRARPAVPDRLARALRPRDDRGDGGGHAGDRLALRLDPRGDRAWPQRLHRRRASTRRSRRSRRAARLAAPASAPRSSALHRRADGAGLCAAVRAARSAAETPAMFGKMRVAAG